MLELVTPGMAYLAEYVAALEREWSPDTGRDVSAAQLALARTDGVGFVANMARTEGGTLAQPDGTLKDRIPGRILWMWDGGFLGTINYRHVPATEELPPGISGHVGYAVVPWMRRRGYGTRALGMLLPIARTDGLRRVLITCDFDNEGSRKVIEAHGGALVGDAPPLRAGEKRKLAYWVSTGDAEASEAASLLV